MNTVTNSHETYRFFAKNLRFTIKEYDLGDQTPEQVINLQCDQFTRLLQAELDFRNKLIELGLSEKAYLAFINYICNVRKNLLLSRPFFRERQEICIGPITRAFKLKDTAALSTFRTNYQFVAFIVKKSGLEIDQSLKDISNNIQKIRNEIIEQNMPLAISQARYFWRRAPARTKDTRFVVMDFIQSAADGLMSAVDKFVIDPEVLKTNPSAIRTWRAVAIGRMRGNFIEMFSDTTLHFWPTDKRKIYRANKHVNKFKDVIDYQKLAEFVNEDLAEDGITTTAEEIRQLLFAANMHDSNTSMTVDDKTTVVNPEKPENQFEQITDEQWRPDTICEDQQLRSSLKDSISALSIFEQKLLQLHGVRMEEL